MIFDSSAFFIPFESTVNLDEELERLLGSFTPVVPGIVLNELERISSRKKNGRAALALARHFLARGVVMEVVLDRDDKSADRKGERDPLSRTDRSVLRLATDLGAPVVTNDRLLKKALTSARIPVIITRKRDHLELVDGNRP